MPKLRRLALALGAAMAAALLVAAVLLWDLPDPHELTSRAPTASVLFYDRSGALLYEALPLHGGRSRPLPLDEIPPHLIQATLATEDAGFYRHPGVDVVGIARAAYYSLRSGGIVAGGSTITQQVARNLLLPEDRYERTLRRKLREAVLALRIEASYDKDEILALYLNSTFYGRLSFGAEAASQAFFGKPLASLDLAECAFLAGLPQAPALYDPERGEAWRDRQRVVLDLMVRQGFISQEEADMAAREPLRFVPPHHGIRAPHFVGYVREQLDRLLGADAVAAGGLRVYTTLDLAAQEQAQQVVAHNLRGVNRDPRVRVSNAAVLGLDLSDGAIRVMVGSADYFDDRIGGALNAVLAPRQPGSAIKPLTYAAAFEAGYTPASMLLDVPSSFITAEGEPYVPINYDYTYRGPVLLREALGSSYNVVAVRLLDEIGVEALQDIARRLEVTPLATAERLGLAATLGGTEVSLYQLTRAYGAFGREGRPLEPYAIVRVTDDRGRVLWEAPRREREPVISPQVSYLITDILSDDKARIPTFGEGSVLALSRPAAVKTGTTTDCRDNWTIGYTPQMVVGVWAGNNDGSSMGPVSGVEGAAPIWRGVMEALHRGLPKEGFAEPPGMVRAPVCALSGLVPGPHCPHHRQELFIAGTEPKEECDLHRLLTPPAADGQGQVYAVLPPEAQAWADARGLPRPPVGGDDGQVSAGLRLVQPEPYRVYEIVPDLPPEAQRLPVEAAVPAGVEVRALRLLVDGQPLAELEAAPFRALWTLEAGEHVFLAELESADGQVQASDPVSVTVRDMQEPASSAR
ncbi:MAG: transglycosylase domain-containing protein [Anaerolineae bacterium]|jgi:penicillin-binding protein 1C